MGLGEDCRGNFRGRRAPVLLALLLLCSGPASAGPSFDYLLHCGGCHLENGEGDPPEVPDLTKNLDYLSGFPEGRAYLVRVPGSSQALISDQRLAELLNWIIGTYYSTSDDFRPFSEEEVARYRKKPLFDPLKERAALMQPR